MSFYLRCNHSEHESHTCRKQRIGGTNKHPWTVWVQGVLKGSHFIATKIGNDANGNLIDETTGTGTYIGVIDQCGVHFARHGNTRFSPGIFVNGTAPTTMCGSGHFQGFTFTFYNSKLETGQTAAGLFILRGTPEEAGEALKSAGFRQRNGSYVEPGYDVYRSLGTRLTGAVSAHFNVHQIVLNPLAKAPHTRGNMHFGEHNPFSPLGWLFHSWEAVCSENS